MKKYELPMLILNIMSMCINTTCQIETKIIICGSRML